MDKIFTAGLVVMNNAYSLNCCCANEPENIISWRFPTKCPIKNRVRNNPDRAARVFLKSVDVKEEVIQRINQNLRTEIKDSNVSVHGESKHLIL